MTNKNAYALLDEQLPPKQEDPTRAVILHVLETRPDLTYQQVANSLGLTKRQISYAAKTGGHKRYKREKTDEVE